MSGDMIGAIEPAYVLDGDERSWLTGVLEAMRPLLDHGDGVFAHCHDIPRGGVIAPRHVIALGAEPGFEALVERYHRALPAPVVALIYPWITGDYAAQRAALRKIGAHLGAALRLRAALTDAAEPEAILSTSGELEHAERAAQAPRATSLRRASTTLRRASTTLRRASTSLRRASTSLRRASTSLRRAPTTLRRTPTTLRRTPTTLRRTPTSLRRVSTTLPRGSTFPRGDLVELVQRLRPRDHDEE